MITPTSPSWQPISSAPRDGTWIEATNPSWRHRDYIETMQWIDRGWITKEGYTYTRKLPTHWRPILLAEPAPVTGTPRTDAEAYEYKPERTEADEFYGRSVDAQEVVPADFARTLETELAAVTAERDIWKIQAQSECGQKCHTQALLDQLRATLAETQAKLQINVEQRHATEAQLEASLKLLKETCDELEQATVGQVIAENEVANLRAANAALTKERDEQHRLAVERLGQCIARQEEIGTLIRERDEARKERDEIENSRDEQWLEVIAKCWNDYKNQPWDTRAGIKSNISALFDEIDTLAQFKAEVDAEGTIPATAAQLLVDAEAARDTALAEAQKLRELLESATRIFDVLDTVTWDENGCPVNYRDAQKDIIRALQPR